MTALRITRVDMQEAANKADHHCSEFSSTMLIVRRAQEFNIILNLNRAMKSEETMGFTVDTGPSPSVSNKTKVSFPLSSSASKGVWSAVQRSGGSTSMSVTISSPHNAIVGFYKFSAQMSSGGQTSSTQLPDFVLLFNAWASGDDVFMPNEEERKEYVLNESGIIYYNIGGAFRNWIYGQFDTDVLEITFQILNSSLEYRRNAAADVAKRNDPKYIGRVMSAMVNNNDQDSGVLVGRWSGSYADGVLPTTWGSSVTILHKWAPRRTPVKYAQCWVYAGVLCTVLRCLGIPSRVITNFESAHDTNANLMIDVVYNEKGMLIESDDSVWNFHVWNEGWFTRSDLGPEFDGWQILDATPQEQSGGIYRLGPASLRAIKEGDIDKDYDCVFVFGEVNADRVQWIEYEDGSREKVYSDSKSVGQRTSTKAVGRNERVDVTNLYKHPEGTAKEREIFNKARSKLPRSSSRMMAFSAASGERVADVPAQKPEYSGKFSVEGSLDVGTDVHLQLILKNESPDSRTVTVKISATTITYTRKPVKEVMTDSQSVPLGPNEEKKVSVVISYAQYKETLTEHNLIEVNAVCEGDKGGKLLVDKDVTLINPPLLIKVNGVAKLNEPYSVEIIFSNPVNKD
ncbi:protein-glutamine gamma-glutamyltransferase E-like, partial [Ailuropoda melanoleuca]|uniref:protein-glutamine gamma-glutamyltransferase E-like n=2 Tax=Tetrapoda TaxID=32523 RepID=UPI0014943113